MRIAVEAVLIETANLESLAAFYQRGFDLPAPQRAADGQLGFQIGGVYLGFAPVERPAKQPGAVSLWFRVPNAQAMCDQLVRLGATVKSPSQQGSEQVAIVFDPEGNAIGLLSASS